MADLKKALDDKTKKIAGQRIENGKEHAAYQEAQQQLLAIQAEQQQNLAVARAESKASFENNQTLAQAAELGAISAAEAEQMAQAGGQVTLNPATQSVLAKYGAGKPKFTRTSSHSQQVTKQNITINNNITSNTTNDVKVPGGVGGPIAGRPLQFNNSPSTPASSTSSTNKFKTWISSAFARQNEEGAKRDREYRHRENSLSKSASKIMKKLEDIGKTIGTRMDPRKIGSTWQSQLKTLLLLFGFGYLTSNWTKVLDSVSKIGDWVEKTWDYFTNGGISKDISGLFGGIPGQSIFESFKALFIGNDKEKGLFGHIKQFFKDMWDERAGAIKLVKAPKIENALEDPMEAIKSLFEYLGNIITAAFSGIDGIKEIKIAEAGKVSTKKSDLNRIANSTTDNRVVKKINGQDEEVEWGTSAFKNEGHKAYKGISHHMLEGDELTSKFGAESSVAQLSEVTRLMEGGKNTGSYDTQSLALYLRRLSKFAGKEGMIPIDRSDLNYLLTPEDIKNLESSKNLVRGVPYRVVYREKNDEDYYRNVYGNDYRNPGVNAAVHSLVNTAGANFVGGPVGFVKSAGTKILGNLRKNNIESESFIDKIDPFRKIEGIATGLIESAGGIQGDAYFAADMANTADNRAKKGQAKYRIEYIRADSPNRPGDIPTGETVFFDEISKEGIRDLSKGLIAKNNPNFDKTISVSPEDIQAYTLLLDRAAKNQYDGYQTEMMAGRMRNEYKYKISNEDADKRLEFYKQETALARENMPEYRYGLQKDLLEVDALKRKTEYNDKRRQNDIENSPLGRVGFRNNSNSSENNLELTSDQNMPEFQNMPIKEKDRANYAISRLMAEGLNRVQAAGIVGNLIAESGLNPAAGHIDNNGKWAGGIAQWNGPRYNEAKKFFGRDLKYVSFEEQLEYLIKELKGEVGDGAVERSGFLRKHGFKKGARILDVMRTTDSLRDSTDTFERIFEGSGDFEGYWTNKGKSNAKFHKGDRNQRRFNLASSVLDKSSNLPEVNYNFNERPQEQTDTSNKSEKEEEISFFNILKKRISEAVSNLGSFLENSKEQVKNVSSEKIDKLQKYSGLENVPINLNKDDTNSGIMPQINKEASKKKNRIVMPTTYIGETPKQLDKSSNDILTKYKTGETPVAKPVENIVPKIDLTSNKIDLSNDFLALLDPKNTKSKSETFQYIADGVGEIRDGIGLLIEQSAINGARISETTQAVNTGTAVNASSSAKIAQATITSGKNQTRRSSSMKEKRTPLFIPGGEIKYILK